MNFCKRRERANSTPISTNLEVTDFYELLNSDIIFIAAIKNNHVFL